MTFEYMTLEEMHRILRNKNPAVDSVGRLYPKVSVRLPVAERKQFPRVFAVLYTS